MKSLNPYCPRNQGVTPIEKGGTGATTAEAALAALGGAPANVLAGVLTGANTNNWLIGFAVGGWGFVIPVNIGSVELNAIYTEIFIDGWKPLTARSSSRMAGDFYLVYDMPEGAELGKCYLSRITYG